MRRLLPVSLLLFAACPPAGGNGTATTGPAQTGGEQPTGGSSTGDACMGSGECDSEGICVADYQAADTMPPGGQRGAAECAPVGECIGPLDLERWCFDHRGCCDDLRCRPADGICEPATLGQTTGSDSMDASTSTSTGDPDPGTGTSDDTGSTGDTDPGTSSTGTSSTSGTSSTG